MNKAVIFVMLPILWAHVCVPTVNGQNYSEAKALLTQLFTTDGYNKKIRPEENLTDITPVEVSFYLTSIIELDEVSEKLVTTGYLVLLWTDKNLVWDPYNYGGIFELFIPQDDIWKPDIVLLNSIKDYKQLGGSSIQVVVYYDGEVYWYPIQVFESSCSIDIRYFPYDIQTCSLTFGAWSYTKNEVLLIGGSGGINLDSYKENSVWKVIDSSWNIELDSGEASIKYTLKLERKPQFVIFSTIVPIIMLSFLNILVFVIPNESGEKAGYAITVFLALAVFLTIISATLPENSDNVALFSIYVTAQIVQSTLITTMSLLFIRLSSIEDNSSIPGCLVKLTRFIKRCRCKGRKTRVDTTDNNASEMVFTTSCRKIGKEVLRNEKKMEKNTNACNDDQDEPKKSEDDGEITWKEALNVLDAICAVFFSLTFAISSSTSLLMARDRK